MLTSLLFHLLFLDALKHSSASVILSSRRFLSGVISFFALLKVCPHLQDVAGQANHRGPSAAG